MCFEECIKLLDSLPYYETTVSEENIFTILNKVRDERTHCRILRYIILQHQKGFLELLSEACHRQELRDEKLISCQCESHCEGIKGCVAFDKEDGKEGSIDILVETEKFYIPIEVKVDAEDQKLQLLRYYEYFKTTKSKEVLLVYITPSGRKATEYSTHCSNAGCISKDCTRNLEDGQYITLGFEDLSKWLKKETDSLQNDSQAGLNVILLTHYREILEQEIKSMEFSKNLLNYINRQGDPLNAKKRFYAALEVYNNFWDIVKEIKEEFFNELSLLLREESIGIELENRPDDSNDKNVRLEFNDYNNTIKVGKRDGKVVCSLCIETNLYIRGGKDLSKWSYITPSWFDEGTPLERTQEKNYINGKKLSGDNNPIVQWYFSDRKSNSLMGLAKHIQEYVNTLEK